MTKINRVSMHGFKSFAHKTDIPFDDKFNCILGPNGAGKSNVGDAICFVLGRLSAKSLRAEKAANLIFNGGKKKRPSASGTVEIAFCNKNNIFPGESNEIVVSRTITKKGNSIYRVNGKRHTRTEILDLLAHANVNPDGYNIILQGDITRFVDMPHVGRRKIIEEISNVTTYEEKKHKALLELNKVEDKLNNAEIILKERKTYLRELKKDRDQALKFKELKEQIDSNKATHLWSQIEEKKKAKEKYDLETRKHEERIEAAEAGISKLKAKIVEHKEVINTINKEIEQKGEEGQLKVHKEIEDIKVTLAKRKARISTLKDEISKIQQRRDQLKLENKELQEKSSSHTQKQRELQQQIKKGSRERQQLEQSIAQFKKKHKIESSQEMDKEIEEKDKLIDKKQEEVQQIRQRQQELLRDKDKIEYQLQTADERIKKVKEVEKENKGQITELQNQKSNFKAATLRLNQLLDHDSSFASQLANARRQLVDLQEKQAKLNARTMSIQAGLAGSEAVKSILSNRKKFRGVHGTVAELGQVNKKYALPLETAAGGRMQNIVVDNDRTAAECIKFLKSNRAGSASFIPLNKIKSRSISPEDKTLLKQEGVHDFAINLITFKPQLKKAYEYVFGNTLVVENIDTARNVGIGRIKMSTLDGNIAEGSGVMRGGFIGRKTSLSFKETDSLEELDKLEGEISQLQGVVSNVEVKRAANETEICTLRNQKAELEAEIIKLEKTLHLETGDLGATSELKKELQEQLDGIEKNLGEVQKDISTINRELADLKSKKHSLRSQVSELRNPRLLAQLTAFEESKQKCRENLLKLQTELKSSSAKTEELYGPEEEKIRDIMKQHDKEETQFAAEMKELAGSIQKNEKELTQKEKASKEFYAKYKALFNKREKLGTEVSNHENDIENRREKSRTHERENNIVSLKNAEIKAKLAGLEEEFSKYKEAPLLKNKDPQEIQKEIARFEIMLSQMSAVNMKALEVYEQIEGEYNKLIEKKKGLGIEKTDVLTLMNEIETKKKDHFMKTYKEVDKNFRRIFASLFKKGNAYLQLDNPQQPFEDGLSVKVKITGKRYMDIKSLSGGEKTLTALSFIFAIQEHQPASFYVLDEIDAALDKHNSETLAKLVRNYVNNAQYILISHNDSVISEADTLFGVSMNEGVSKVTSLKI